MKSCIDFDTSSVNRATSELASGDDDDDFRVNTTEGFDSIPLTSSAASSPDSLTPTSFRNIVVMNEAKDSFIRNAVVVESNDFNSTTVANLCRSQVDTTGTTSHQSPPAMRNALLNRNNSPRRCHTALWDERINWSKSNSEGNRELHRSFRSEHYSGSDSTTSSEGSFSTQLFLPQPPFTPQRPTTTLHRNISTSTSSSSSLSLSDDSGMGEHELQLSDRDDDHPPPPPPPQLVESRNPIFFSPRRRVNSLVYANQNRNMTLDSITLSSIPIAEVSIPTLMNDPSPEDDNSYDAVSSRGIWRFFAPHHASRNNPYQRRNLLLLFLIATYTTFGLASPDIQKVASTLLTNSKIGNVVVIDDTVSTVIVHDESLNDSSNNVNDVSLVVDYDTERTSTAMADVTLSSQLRGSISTAKTTVDQSNPTRKDTSVINGHLAFARGGGNSPMLVYRRREMNDFYHQPALLQDDTTATTSWYLNCVVLMIIAIYYIIREHKKVFLSCTISDGSTGTSSSSTMIHNTHHL